jgi:hypothetical protein
MIFLIVISPLLAGLGTSKLKAKQRLDIPAAPDHMQNQHVFPVDSVKDKVLADGKTAHARP